MSVDSFFIQVATVERNAADVVDGPGTANPIWATYVESLPCSFQPSGGGERMLARLALKPDYTHRLYCAVADVTEADRIVNVRMADGSELGLYAGKVFEIVSIQNPAGRNGYLKVLLWDLGVERDA